MESISKFTAGVLSGFKHVEGDCERHGHSEMSVHPIHGAWHCPTCHQEKVAAEVRERWLADRNETLLKIATIPGKYMGQRFTATTPEQVKMRRTMRDFRDFVLADGGPRWSALILTGITGTGKTLAVSEFAESWVRKLSKSARYITANGMIKEIQASYGAEGKSEEGEILRFVQYDLLILDEVDAKPDSPNANLLLTEVINRRYNESKPVIVISNQPFDSLSHYIGDRVHSRLHENAFIAACTWQDFRKTMPGG